MTLRHVVGPILVIFDNCHFMIILGPFEYLLEKKSPLRKSKFSQWRSNDCPLLVFFGPLSVNRPDVKKVAHFL